MSYRVKRFARWVIAVVVVIGLVLATRKAVFEWRHQRKIAIGRVTEIEAAIAIATTSEQRTELERELCNAQSQIPDLSRLSWPRVGLAAVFYAIGLIPGGMVLHEGTRVLGYRVRMVDALAAQVVGHLGKYVPGKAMVVVIRAERLARVGIPVVAGSIAVFLETLLMMAVGAAVAGSLIFFLPVPRWIAWAAVSGGMIATLPTLPPILRRIVGRVAAKKQIATDAQSAAADPVDASQSVRGGWRYFSLAWFWQLVAWGLIGTSFALLVDSLPRGIEHFPMTTVYTASVASIALAMVVGFASLLPGGAGVRELTLALVLAPVVGGSQALLAAILARLLFIFVEFVAAFAVMLAGGPREKQPQWE